MSVISWTCLAFALMLLAGSRWRIRRRTKALNRALHEIRRPLQTLSLLSPAVCGPVLAGAGPTPDPGAGLIASPRISLAEPVAQAIDAVGDLDRELNGGPATGRRSEVIAARLMVDGCIRRWQSRAAIAGSTIELSWGGPDALIRGDGVALAAALENLIVNAIEHGGPRITVLGRQMGKRLRIEVADDGLKGRLPGRARTPAETPARQRGRGRHGHGLAVAEQTASEHGGRLEKQFSAGGSRVAFILPRATRSRGMSSAVKVNW